MKKILFVCTGNTCRSCMAEGIFNAAVEKDTGLQGNILSISAGTSAYDGDFASEHAVKALQEEWGIDIRPHRSRSLQPAYVREADLILTMTRQHKQAIIAAFPEAVKKVHTLKEFVRETAADKASESYDFGLDIVDPYGMNLQVYKKCAREIKDAVDKLIEKIRRA